MGLSVFLWYFINKNRKEEEQHKAVHDLAKFDNSETKVVIDEPTTEPISPEHEATVMFKHEPEPECLQAAQFAVTRFELDLNAEPMQVHVI